MSVSRFLSMLCSLVAFSSLACRDASVVVVVEPSERQIDPALPSVILPPATLSQTGRAPGQAAAAVPASNSQYIDRGQTFVISGSYYADDAAEEAAPVVVKLVQKRANGKSITIDSRSAKQVEEGNGEFNYRADVTASKKPGTFYAQAWSGRRMISERQINVK